MVSRSASPIWTRPGSRTAAHHALATPGEELAAEETILAIAGAIRGDGARMRDAGVAMSLRDLMESNLAGSVTLAEAARIIGAHPNQSVALVPR